MPLLALFLVVHVCFWVALGLFFFMFFLLSLNYMIGEYLSIKVTSVHILIMMYETFNFALSITLFCYCFLVLHSDYNHLNGVVLVALVE